METAPDTYTKDTDWDEMGRNMIKMGYSMVNMVNLNSSPSGETIWQYMTGDTLSSMMSAGQQLLTAVNTVPLTQLLG